jgi:hypothetical protein
MAAPYGQPQDIQAIAVLAVLIGILCVIYWRIALRIFLIALIALAIYGAVLAVHGLHHM